MGLNIERVRSNLAQRQGPGSLEWINTIKDAQNSNADETFNDYSEKKIDRASLDPALLGIIEYRVMKDDHLDGASRVVV